MGLKIDGIATNGALDSSGEILNVGTSNSDGIDISDLVEGKGILNWEHEKSSEDTIGAIIFAKKINSAKDCDNDRQREYWAMSKIPYVYIIAELFDDEEHPGAVAAAALIRYYAKRKEKLLAGFSIEGQTLTRKGNTLERSVARKVALTLRPCNKACLAGLLEDPKAKAALDKCQVDAPSAISAFQVDSVVFEDPIEEVREAVTALRKTLEGGSYASAPGTLVGGSALQVEDKSMRNRLKAVVRDWDRTRPLKEVIKAALPELGDGYVDHFATLAHDLMMKKGLPGPARIDAVNSINPHADEEQKSLINGLYMDPNRKRKVGPEKRQDVFGLRNDAGKNVVIKLPGVDASGKVMARNATAYYQLARDFFGMKDHVPTTNYFSHAGTDNLHQAMEHVEGETALESKDLEKTLDAHKVDGSLHRLALMDLITGHGDRHYGNVMVGKDKKLKHIDNDDAFTHGNMAKPSYFSDLKTRTGKYPGIDNEALSAENAQWLKNLDPRKMASMLSKMRISPEGIAKSVHALKTIQSGADGHLGIHVGKDPRRIRMKVYVVTSLTSKTPLVEFRTDGTGLDFTVDNTDGKFPTMVGNSFAKLKALISRSSNLNMAEPKEPTAHILRYLLDNGDVVEITTDGRTAILNGKLLQEAEKQAIFSAIRSGELKVSKRADTSAPVPVVPSRSGRSQGELRRNKQTMHKGMIAAARSQNEAIAAMQARANSSNDEQIENMSLSDLDTPDDMAMTRGMLYYIRHGQFKGSQDA